MLLNTKHFGEIELDESKIIGFDGGIPGFPNLNRFIILSEPDDGPDGGVFFWLQSVEDGAVSFVIVDMLRIMPDYNPIVDISEFDGLGEYDPEKFCVYNMAVVPQNLRDMTVNLKAPVVINTELKKGRQIICQNEDYAIRHYVFH